jgi:hypothetical protein
VFELDASGGRKVRMKSVATVLLAIVVGCAGCKRVPTGAEMDRSRALKVSDAFISAIQNRRFDDALSLMGPENVQSINRTQIERIALEALDYCGRPGQVVLERDEIGVFLYASGKKSPMRRFIYGSPTPGSDCIFYVDVVPGADGEEVAKFGASKP